MIKFYNKNVLPYFFYFAYYINITFIFILFRKRKKSKTILCIEAGENGWESIEYKELLTSAKEYLTETTVIKNNIIKNISYINQMRKCIKNHKPTHYFYDPRTGSQNFFIGILESFYISWVFAINGIIPIVFLTDFSFRRWRFQSAIITANNGVVISFMPFASIINKFPHNRYIGPNIIPISNITLTKIEKIMIENKFLKDDINFIGSLYEPRTTILNQLKIKLQDKGINFNIHGRNLGSKRVPDDEYWYKLINSKITFTTAEQNISVLRDWNNQLHLVYRYLEAMMCGTLLVAPNISGITRFFRPNIDFVCYDNIDNAVDLIIYYNENDEERLKISESGKLKAKALIISHSFWQGIDILLRNRALTLNS
jgi:glycosyltransferase involved in cell wall biosynthesis